MNEGSRVKSIRCEEFTQVFSHDAKAQPEECVGPVFAIKNGLRGTSVAGPSKTTTVPIPAVGVLGLMGKAMETTKMKKYPAILEGCSFAGFCFKK